MLFFAPGIVYIFENIETNSIKKFMWVASVPIILIPTCGVIFNPFANTIMLFCFYFALGVLIKKSNQFWGIENLPIKIIVLVIFVFVTQISLSLIGRDIPVIYNYRNWLSGNNSLLMLLITLGIFIIVLKQKAFYSPIVNKVASTAFGVYLIHDNEYVRNLLWGKYVTIDLIESKNLIELIVFIIVLLVLIYACCMIIEYIRLFIFEKLDIDNKIYCIFVWIAEKIMTVLKTTWQG